ncbi:MAG TPA: response regulator [Chloroflexota bacterium]
MMEKPGPVILIEDEPMFRALIREVLEAEGREVIALGHPDLLRALPDGVDPDLIVIDLMLPGESGLQLARELRDGPYAHTPMIALSADRLALLFAERSGLFQETMAKPFDLTMFLQTTQHYLGRYVCA